VAKQQKKTERQAKIDAIRNQQKGAERRRGLMIVGVAVVIALLIIAYPLYSIWKDNQELAGFQGLELAEIGAPASVCQDVEETTATGGGDHVEPGTDITYEDSPPAFGTHYDIWADIERKFYTAEDRPDVGELVHNLEHGYTILWYDETIADNEAMLDDVRGIASKFTDDSNFRNKFKAVPWTSEDGDSFPDGQHVAFTHWGIGADGDPQGEQFGISQFCAEPSGEALEQFMLDYPYTDSPEGNVPDM
jgi:Protein of unknown function (DUF3105)